MPADAGGDLPADLRAAVVRVAATGHLLVALDFDGTLAPLVPRADDARPLPAAAAALSALSGLESTTTALVSGRALASLRSVAGPPDATLLIASHGAETWLGPGSAPLELTPAQSASLVDATTAFESIAAAHPGTLVEYKPAGVVLHYRQAGDHVGAAAVAQLRERLERRGDIFLSDGKKVLEASVVRADKGQGVRLLREAAAATAVLFAGDDVTDEHGFAALGPGDVGIKVGDGATAAPFRVGGPADLGAVLELLLAERISRSGMPKYAN
ncbi:trehalose-phosphatase [Specibacter cremeus]|uniref:trehalose-phosphatase n=1 Tax=Specibacter cremeus TaxID=1629051 RepID=UPI000F7A0607|nr:trehalose-phosphatase [Specibacter cremeus]